MVVSFHSSAWTYQKASSLKLQKMQFECMLETDRDCCCLIPGTLEPHRAPWLLSSSGCMLTTYPLVFCVSSMISGSLAFPASSSHRISSFSLSVLARYFPRADSDIAPRPGNVACSRCSLELHSEFNWTIGETNKLLKVVKRVKELFSAVDHSPVWQCTGQIIGSVFLNM